MTIKHPVSERTAAGFHLLFALYYLIVAGCCALMASETRVLEWRVIGTAGILMAAAGFVFHVLCSGRHWASR